MKLGSMCGATITNKSQERTRDVYDYYNRCLQLEHDQPVRNNTELLLDAYNTEANAAVGAWVWLSQSRREVNRGGQRDNSRVGHTHSGVGRSAVSSRGEILTRLAYVRSVLDLNQWFQLSKIWKIWKVVPDGLCQLLKSVLRFEYLIRLQYNDVRSTVEKSWKRVNMHVLRCPQA